LEDTEVAAQPEKVEAGRAVWTSQRVLQKTRDNVTPCGF